MFRVGGFFALAKLARIQPMVTSMAGPNVELWIEPEKAKTIDRYAAYWNDDKLELSKVHPDTAGFDGIERYYDDLGLADDFRACIDHLNVRPGGDVINLAAGILWDLRLIFDQLSVRSVTCVEYSKHRLLDLGPRVIDHYRLDRSQISLALGSFYDVKRPDASFDTAVLCQALHHADDPTRLLVEAARVLRPGGTIIVTGEPIVPWNWRRDVAHVVKAAILNAMPDAMRPQRLRGQRRPLIAKAADYFPAEPDLGDHYHFRRDYRRMFAAAGFTAVVFVRPGAKHLSIVGVRK